MTDSPKSDQAGAAPPRSLARVVRVVGIIIALVSIGYVGRAIVQNQIWQTNTASLTQIIGFAILGGGVYAVINVIFSEAGNVFHYSSSHVLGTLP